MSDSPTPETDSVTRSSDETPWTPWVCAGHAKRLERERDEARIELERVRKELVASNRGAERNAKVNQGLCAKLAEAERERDDALGGWDFANEGWSKALEGRDDARRERDEAISKLKFAQNELFTILRFQEDEKREHRNLLERLSFFQNRFESMRAERDQAMGDLDELREELKEQA